MNFYTMKDSPDDQSAAAQALTVLKEFYAKAVEATALAQSKQSGAAPNLRLAEQWHAGRNRWCHLRAQDDRVGL